jgi:acyl-CoA dehydrogenase
MSDRLVRDSAERLFGDLSTPALINAAESGTWPAPLWQAVSDAGFLDALAAGAEGPGDLSGIGDAAAILWEAGRFAVPLPLAETMLGRWLLASAGLTAPEGPLALAPVERDSSFLLRRQADGWHLSGRATGIAWPHQAAGIVVVVGGDVACLPPAAAALRDDRNLAGEPRGDLSVDTLLDAKAAAPLVAGIDPALVYRLGALSRAVLMAGALDAVLELTVRYANDRVQFGRPIAKFQAIQQQLAVLAENVAASGVIANAAVEAVARKSDIAFSVAVAKSRIGEAAGKVAEIAHQVHGAIGFTHEHRLHHLTRRLWSWRDEYGVESDWAMELGRMVASHGADGLWPLLTVW